jgi:HSP90 family molecular chaperone
MKDRPGRDLLHHCRHAGGSQECFTAEIFRKKGIEVLLMADRVDEWALNYLVLTS